MSFLSNRQIRCKDQLTSSLKRQPTQRPTYKVSKCFNPNKLVKVRWRTKMWSKSSLFATKSRSSHRKKPVNLQLKFQAVTKALTAGYHTVTLFMDLWLALIMKNLWYKHKCNHQFKSKSSPKLFPNKNSAYEALTWKSAQTYHQGMRLKSPVRWRTA